MKKKYLIYCTNMGGARSSAEREICLSLGRLDRSVILAEDVGKFIALVSAIPDAALTEFPEDEKQEIHIEQHGAADLKVIVNDGKSLMMQFILFSE